jgi:hypothetical protein
MDILAGIIGISITILLKMLILSCLRTRLYAGLYRRRPAAANLSRLVLECWNLGLSSGYIMIRSAKLILFTILYLGRIDTPFLAPGIGWVSNEMPLDNYPIDFRKDLILHEAVRGSSVSYFTKDTANTNHLFFSCFTAPASLY